MPGAAEHQLDAERRRATSVNEPASEGSGVAVPGSLALEPRLELEDSKGSRDQTRSSLIMRFIHAPTARPPLGHQAMLRLWATLVTANTSVAVQSSSRTEDWRSALTSIPPRPGRLSAPSSRRGNGRRCLPPEWRGPKCQRHFRALGHPDRPLPGPPLRLRPLTVCACS